MSEISELYQCQVCWENMLHLRPRSLKCGHSFCEECLGRLLRSGCISCPTCRTETAVERDVSDLPIDFKLSKFKDMEKDLVLNIETVCQMCFVKGNKVAAKVKCIECNRMMCESCTQLHDKIPAVRGHKKQKVIGSSSNVCPLHGQAITYLCHKCMKAICLDCMFSSDHVEHNDCIEEFKSGCEKMRIKSEEILNDMEHEKMKLEKRTKQVALDLTKMRNIEQNFLDEKMEQETNVKEMVEKLEDLKINHVTVAENVKRKLEDMYNALIPTCLLFGKIQEKNDEVFITKLAQALPESQKKLKQTQEVLSETYRMPSLQTERFEGQTKMGAKDILSSKPVFSLLLLPGEGSSLDNSLESSDDSFEEFENRSSKKTVVKPVVTKHCKAIKTFTSSIIALDLYTVLIVNYGDKKLIRVDNKGNIVAAYYMPENEKVVGSYFYGQNIYTITANENQDVDSDDGNVGLESKLLCIPVHSEYHSDTKLCTLSVRTVFPLPTFFDGNIIFFATDDSNDASDSIRVKLVKYSITQMKTKVNQDIRLTLSSASHCIKVSKHYNKKRKDCFILTCNEGILMLDTNWQILKKIEQDQDSEYKYGGLFVFDTGDFLVARGNKVCLYDSSGSFRKDILTDEEHGIKYAVHVEVQGHRLWVLESRGLDFEGSDVEDGETCCIRCYDYK